MSVRIMTNVRTATTIAPVYTVAIPYLSTAAG